jgi:hypothetical protein
MTKRKSIHGGSMLIIMLLLFSAAISLNASIAVAQQSESKSSSDLSGVNWDSEEEPIEGMDTTVDDEELSSASWEDEDSSEGDAEESGGLQSFNQAQIDKLDSEERLIHISGFLLFFGYIVGGILTAFITRNRKIAVYYPPELLILLHTVWPLELMLLPFLGKPVR